MAAAGSTLATMAVVGSIPVVTMVGHAAHVALAVAIDGPANQGSRVLDVGLLLFMSSQTCS